MTRVVVDEGLKAQFTDLTADVEICDKSGRVLGYFYPVDQQEDEFYAQFKCPLTEDELERREREPGGSSLAEFWHRMDPK